MSDTIAQHPWFVVLAALAVLIVLEACFGEADAARAGGERTVTNFALYGLSLAALGLVAFAFPAAGQHPLVPDFGLIHWLDLSWTTGLAALLLVDSFLAYWLHRASHAIPLLWRLHKVHHSDRSLDTTTSLRHHPLEALPALAVQIAGVAVTGASADQVMIVFVVNTVWALWTHAALGSRSIGLPRPLTVLVSPAFHRLHHSARQDQTDSNYANLIAAWDWLFGTARDPARESVDIIGLDAELGDEARLGAQLLHPFRSRDVRPANL